MTELKMKGMFDNCIVVENPQECKDFTWLIDKEVDVSGKKIKVYAVHVSSLPPYKKGELIALVQE